MDAQGYSSENTIVYQDNKSSILLEKNGKASSSKRTRHINIRYYFVTDRINNGEIDIVYCPTKQMIADFFTKPLQGTAFTEFRNFIMNVASDGETDNNQNHRSVLNSDDEENPGVHAVNTIHGYNNDYGFTIVTRRVKKVNTNKIRTIDRQPNNLSSNKVKKVNMPVGQNNGKGYQGKRAIAHYI